MNEITAYLAAFCTGAAAGTIFMSILWRSLRYLGKNRHSALQMLAYGLLRHGIVYLLFYFSLYFGGWSHLLAALFGFIVVRSLTLTRSVKTKRINGGLL